MRYFLTDFFLKLLNHLPRWASAASGSGLGMSVGTDMTDKQRRAARGAERLGRDLRKSYEEERPFSAREITNMFASFEKSLSDKIEAARTEAKTDNNIIIAKVTQTNGTARLHTKIMWAFGAAILTLAASSPDTLGSIIKLVTKI